MEFHSALESLVNKICFCLTSDAQGDARYLILGNRSGPEENIIAAYVFYIIYIYRYLHIICTLIRI